MYLLQTKTSCACVVKWQRMKPIQSYLTSSPLSKFSESILYSMEARDIENEKEKNEKKATR